MLFIYILDRYSYGREAYKTDFSYCKDLIYFPKSFKDKLSCMVTYLKAEGKSKEYIFNYINNLLDDILVYDSNREKKIRKRYKLYTVIKELETEYSTVNFSTKEIDYIKNMPKNKGRIVFCLLCIYKMYGDKYIHITDKHIRRLYENKIDCNTLSKYLHELVKSGIINSKIITNKFSNDINCILVLSDKLISIYDDNDIKYSFNNLGNLPLLFDYIIGENNNIVFCTHCGNITERKSNRQSLCEECRVEIRREKVKNNVRNFRKRNM